MQDTLNILKIGTTKENYPPYGQFINFSDKIQTCNEDIYVEFDENKFPINGHINLFALDEVLKSCKDPQIEQDDSKLKINDGNFKTSILIDEINFPQHSPVNVDFIKLEEEFLYQLKTAVKYTGDGIFSYVVINDKYILASENKKKVFYYKHDFDVKNIIGINSKIFQVLDKDLEVGTFEHNTVVKFDGGKIIFKIALLDNFPSDQIVSIVEEKPEINKLCNIASLKDAVRKVSSILVNEKFKYIKLYNKNKEVSVKAESETCGVSEIKIDSFLDDEWKTDINFDALSTVDLDFDLFVTKENNHLYLTNEKAEIIIAGI